MGSVELFVSFQVLVTKLHEDVQGLQRGDFVTDIQD